MATLVSTSTPPNGALGGLSRGQFLGVTCLFWAYVTVSNVLYAYGMSTGFGRIVDVPLFAGWQVRVIEHLILLPFLLLSYWASLRVRWRPLWAGIPLQISLGVVFAALAYPAMVAAEMLRGEASLHGAVMSHGAAAWREPLFRALWLASWVTFLPAYGFGLALVTGLALYTRFRDAELQVAALEHAFGTARLAALRMQLSPHTLFNLLHTIRGHIEWDPKAAQSMILRLSDLLRRLLNAGEHEFVCLAEELQFVRTYLELQQARFPDRLAFSLPRMDGPGRLWLPSLILQPLVENAVVHGLAGHQGRVSIEVSAAVSADRLTLGVANDVAPGRPTTGTGIGLANVRERLSVQFPGRSSVVAGLREGRWVTEISLPLLSDSPGPPT